jgi:hypothetical protein
MIDQCCLIELPKINEPRGNLTFIESGRHTPLPIQRVYYLYNVSGGAERGGQLHKALHRLLIAISGSFDVHLDDGHDKNKIRLNHSFNGLYTCPMIWREIDNFSSGAVCLVLALDYYDPDDCYRVYE